MTWFLAAEGREVRRGEDCGCHQGPAGLYPGISHISLDNTLAAGA